MCSHEHNDFSTQEELIRPEYAFKYNIEGGRVKAFCYKSRNGNRYVV